MPMAGPMIVVAVREVVKAALAVPGAKIRFGRRQPAGPIEPLAQRLSFEQLHHDEHGRIVGAEVMQ